MNVRVIVFYLLTLLTFLSCTKEGSEPLLSKKYEYDWENHEVFQATYQMFNLPYTTDYDFNPAQKGTVAMSEASGVAYSRINPGMIWAHNDSGHPNVLFLLNAETGETVARYTIKGAANVDWEDMEIAIDPVDNISYVYIADTGDNHERRPDYSVYKFREPVFQPEHKGLNNNYEDPDLERYRFRYPDGSHDTEAMFVDPTTRDIYLATKRDVVSFLYVIPYPQVLDDIYTIYKVGEFSFREASAGSVSPDGKRVMIKNRQDIFYWTRSEGEEMMDVLKRAPVRSPYVGEPQGEAICFDEDNNYFTLSEQTNQLVKPILYKYFLNQ